MRKPAVSIPAKAKALESNCIGRLRPYKMIKSVAWMSRGVYVYLSNTDGNVGPSAHQDLASTGERTGGGEQETNKSRYGAHSTAYRSRQIALRQSGSFLYLLSLSSTINRRLKIGKTDVPELAEPKRDQDLHGFSFEAGAAGMSSFFLSHRYQADESQHRSS